MYRGLYGELEVLVRSTVFACVNHFRSMIVGARQRHQGQLGETRFSRSERFRGLMLPQGESGPQTLWFQEFWVLKCLFLSDLN